MIRYIVIPETTPGKGTGHLVRCMDLASFLPEAALLIPEERRSDLLRRYPTLAQLTLCEVDILKEQTEEGRLFIVDKPIFTLQELLPLLDKGLVAGIDVRGSALTHLPFVVDLLPRLHTNLSWKKPNIDEPRFLKLPSRKREQAQTIKKVLVAFGGEDAGNLRARLIDSGILGRDLPHAEVDMLSGPQMKPLNIPLPSAWKELQPQAILSSRLHEWDLVITSFGLTAYEASAAGCRVLLLNPAAYHQALTRRAGFPSFGVKKPSASLFRKALQLPSKPLLDSAPPVAQVAHQQGPAGLASLFQSLQTLHPSSCPACQSTGNRVIARFPNRSFFSCRRCGIWYETLFAEQTIQYNEAYFFQEYEKQYGKTYLDDFSHIQAMGRERLDQIQALGTNKTGSRLLDIGCAYGPFLQAAAERGMHVQGCDISPEAVEWVQKNLGFAAQSGDIRTKTASDFGGQLDVVSLWYVIEHFSDLYRLLRTLNTLLLKGGVLALSTPSGSGISARARRQHFLAHSPLDHYTIWRPSTVKRLLSLYGFRLRSIRITGHHPERFPFFMGTGFFRPLSMLLSRFFGLGDTFELYAEKIHDIQPETRKDSI